jgi:uracil DNA glycosylase
VLAFVLFYPTEIPQSLSKSMKDLKDTTKDHDKKNRKKTKTEEKILITHAIFEVYFNIWVSHQTVGYTHVT